MVATSVLLSELRRLLPHPGDDLRERCRAVPEVDAGHRECEGAKGAGRVGDAYEAWCADRITQAAVAWILGCVFRENLKVWSPPPVSRGRRARKGRAR